MNDKCPKCGIEGEKVSDRAVYVMHPPEPGKTGPFGRAEIAGKYHIIDSPQCLKRQLEQAKAVIAECKRKTLLEAAKWVDAMKAEVPSTDQEKQGLCDIMPDQYDDPFEVERDAFEAASLKIRRMAKEAQS